MNRIPFCFALFIVLQVFTFQKSKCQQNDFQFWPSFQVNLEVINKLKLHVEEELRLRENSTQFSRQINDIGLSYRFNKYLKAALFYRIEAEWENVDEYDWRNGLYGDVSLRYEPRRFTIGYRLRIQSSKAVLKDKQSYMFNGFRHRHKISAEYDIKGIPLAPFAEGELFVEHENGRGSELSGYRIWVGLNYTLSKVQQVTIKYGIDQELNASDPLRAYIIALGYTLDLKL